MKKSIIRLALCFIIISSFFICSGFTTDYEQIDSVYLGGFAAGFSIKSRGAEIVGVCDVITDYGVVSPSRDAGIAVGDRVMSVNGRNINCSNDIELSLVGCKGNSVVVVVKRGADNVIKDVVPAKDLNGAYKLGLFIRDNLNGIGTMTFIKKNGDFMALGHPIVEDAYGISDIVSGDIYRCSIIGVNKGERGKAGELKGIFIKDDSIGAIQSNVNQGLKGKMHGNFETKSLKSVQVGSVRVGNAKMVTSIDGVEPLEYDISIVKIDDVNKDSKNFVVKVIDDRLIKSAGGIVQGMSGSPILQDGKIVGAVTHVFLNDPTRGYGITIQNMLNS